MAPKKGAWSNIPNRHPDKWEPCNATAAMALDIMYSGIAPASCPPDLEEIVSTAEEMTGCARGTVPEPPNKRLCVGPDELCLCPGQCRVHYMQNMTEKETEHQRSLEERDIKHGEKLSA